MQGHLGGVKLREIGITLGKALGLRKRADYMLDKEVSVRDLQEEILYAKRVKTFIREYQQLVSK